MLKYLATLTTLKSNPVNSYMFKSNNENTRTRCEICSKSIIKPGIVLVPFLLILNIFHTFILCFYY